MYCIPKLNNAQNILFLLERNHQYITMFSTSITINYFIAPSRKRRKEGWVTKKPNYIRKVNKLSSEQIKDHNKKHEKVNDQHVKNAVQEVFLDDLLNIIQMDAKRTILNKRSLKNIETQPIIVESFYKLRNADTNIEPRLVEEVTKYKKVQYLMLL